MTSSFTTSACPVQMRISETNTHIWLTSSCWSSHSCLIPTCLLLKSRLTPPSGEIRSRNTTCIAQIWMPVGRRISQSPDSKWTRGKPGKPGKRGRSQFQLSWGFNKGDCPRWHRLTGALSVGNGWVAGGCWDDLIFPFSWECHNPNWLSLHHFSEGLAQPTSS